MTVGSRAQVYHGNATETAGGLKKKAKESKTNPWIKAVAKAKKELGITGFALVQGKLLTRAREIYSK